MVELRSPLNWMGGKSAEAGYIAGLLPDHTCYVEVFGGGASVLLAKRPSVTECYNDRNGDLVNLFRVLRDDPEAFKSAWKRTLVSRQEFRELLGTDPALLSPVQRAYRFLYINRSVFGGDMLSRSWGIGGASRSSLAYWLENYETWIDSLHRRLMSAYIDHDDWSNILARWDPLDSSPSGTVFFLDPPYLGTAGYEVGEFTEEDHRRLATRLKSLRGRFLLTINDHPVIRELYAGCCVLERTKRYTIARAAKARKEYGELIIANYELHRTQQSTLI